MARIQTDLITPDRAGMPMIGIVDPTVRPRVGLGLHEAALPVGGEIGDTPISDLPGDGAILGAILRMGLNEAEAEQITALLMARFGSLAIILAAPLRRLEDALGSHARLAPALKSVHQAVRAVLREPLLHRTSISSWQQLDDYLKATLGHDQVEQVRLLLLDRKNRLIRDELHAKGTIDHVPLYPREVIRRVIEMEASAVIVVHNHPSGDPTPSGPDLEITQALADVLGQIGVCLHDHVIVGSTGVVSLRARKLFDQVVR